VAARILARDAAPPAEGQEQRRGAKARRTAGAGAPAAGGSASGSGGSDAPSASAGPVRSGSGASSGGGSRGKPAKPAAAGPTRARERALRAAGHALVAGVDEAGRGPLAGPVVAAACVLPDGLELEGLDDSKKLSEEDRERLYAQITGAPGVAWAV
jgi:hypothetical protein